MRAWVPLLLVVCFAGVPCWWLFEPTPGPAATFPSDTDRQPVPTGSAPSVAEWSPAVQREEAPPPETDKQAIIQDINERYRALQEEARRRSSSQVRGRILVRDRQGVEYTCENGEVQAYLVGGMRSGVTCEVIAGEFLVEMREGHALSIRDLVLNGRRVRVNEYEFPVQDQELVIRGHWAAPKALRVVDAVTGASLPQVMAVVCPERRLHAGLLTSGSQAQQDAQEQYRTSPLLLPPPRTSEMVGTTPVLVGAPGYAWKTTRVDFRMDGEHLVELSPGATLEVTVLTNKDIPAIHVRLQEQVDLRQEPGDHPPEDLAFRWLARVREQERLGLQRHPGGISSVGDLSREQVLANLAQSEAVSRESLGQILVSERAHTDAPVVWRGLPAGTFALTVAMGDTHTDRILFRQDVLLEEGRTCRLRIILPEPEPTPEPARLVPLSGTLFVPEEWWKTPDDPASSLQQHDNGRQSVSMFSRDPSRALALAAVPDAQGLFRWDMGSVAPGEYLLTIRGPHPAWHVRATTGPGGNESVALAVPPPAEVTVDLLDARTSSPVEDLFLMGQHGVIEWDPSARAYQARTFPGEYWVRIRPGDGWAMLVNLGARLEPGPNTLTRELRRVSTIRLMVQENGHDRYVGPEWISDIEVRCLSGGGTRVPDLWNYWDLLVTEGGLYEIAPSDLRGYEAIAPVQVEVPDGELVEVRLDVIRSQ